MNHLQLAFPRVSFLLCHDLSSYARVSPWSQLIAHQGVTCQIPWCGSMGALHFSRSREESVIPAEVASQQFVEAGVMRREEVDQAFARGRMHLRGPGRIILLELCFFPARIKVRQVEECQRLFEDGCRICVEVLALQEQELFLWKEAHPALELVCVHAPCQVGKMAVVIAGIVFIGLHLFSFSGKPRPLACDG